jgi:hypothetical protein
LYFAICVLHLTSQDSILVKQKETISYLVDKELTFYNCVHKLYIIMYYCLMPLENH